MHRRKVWSVSLTSPTSLAAFTAAPFAGNASRFRRRVLLALALLAYHGSDLSAARLDELVKLGIRKLGRIVGIYLAIQARKMWRDRLPLIVRQILKPALMLAPLPEQFQLDRIGDVVGHSSSFRGASYAGDPA